MNKSLKIHKINELKCKDIFLNLSLPLGYISVHALFVWRLLDIYRYILNSLDLSNAILTVLKKLNRESLAEEV